MYTIATLTMNPALDLSCEVERVIDTHKMRATGERYSPGGGGINVARVFVRFGGQARCHYLSGGPVGTAYDNLVDLHQLVRRRTVIAGNTRASTTILERSSGREFRFVPEGPEVAESEWQALLDELGEAECDFVVASGSLPKGAPDDFYARAAKVAVERGARFVLDTSGRALAPGLAEGGVFLFKPSLGELGQLAGKELEGVEDAAAAAMEVVEGGRAEHVAVTLGHRGAVLANRGGTTYQPAIPIKARSSVGAGDSFLATMVYRLCAGDPPEEAFRYGVAAGAAAVLTPGTDMCRVEDVERLYRRLGEGSRNPGS
jgi:6-phosphofructokinase 2